MAGVRLPALAAAMESALTGQIQLGTMWAQILALLLITGVMAQALVRHQEPLPLYIYPLELEEIVLGMMGVHRVPLMLIEVYQTVQEGTHATLDVGGITAQGVVVITGCTTRKN